LQYLEQVERVYASYAVWLKVSDTLNDQHTEFHYRADSPCQTHTANLPVYDYGCLTDSGIFYLKPSFDQDDFKDKILFLIQEGIYSRYHVTEDTYYRTARFVDLTKLLIRLVEEQQNGRRTPLTNEERQTLNEIYPRSERVSKDLLF